MKYVVPVLVLILTSAVFAGAVSGQTPQPKKPASSNQPNPQAARKAAKTRGDAPRSAARAAPTPVPLTEKERYDTASALELAADRVAALEKFLADFPRSEHRPAAAELLASSRVLIAEEKLLTGDADGAVAIFRRVVEDAPQPVPSELFTESIARIPMTLYRRGQRAAAAELALLIETRIEGDAGQLVELANFYLSTENGTDAMRVAAKAMAKDPASPAVYRTLALTHRINFDLELSADAYAKALELDPTSVAAKRGLADMKRALGRSDEALALYRELAEKNGSDAASRTGMVLALFDAGKRDEAEAEMTRLLEADQGNFILLSGAAYWYASRGVGDRAVELARKAIDREPRYIWSHIALARGLMAQGKPVAAEQALIKARAYGNFPTLEYELASARIAAGFFRDAVEDLARHFSVTPSGIKTRLGGRFVREDKSFAELLAPERRASIFAPNGADAAENGAILRGLLEFEQKLQAAEANGSEIAAAVDGFTNGSDKMRVHRQIYAASRLLERKIALDKVLELTRAATGNTDTALDVPEPGAAVMASELYEPRTVAFRRNEFLLVPDVPRPVLSAILRGRLEEIAGWTLYHQANYADAIVRLRRSISVIPPNSAWSRSSLWRLGAALAADGKDAEALEAYINSYKTDKPDFGKYVIVEALYKKVHGSTDGLEAKIGAERVAGARPATTLPAPAAASETAMANRSAGETVPATPPADAATETKQGLPPTEVVKPETTTPDVPAENEKASAAPVPNDPPSVEKSVEKPEVKKDVSTDTPAAERPSEQAEVKKDAAEVKTDTPAAERPSEQAEVKKDAAEVKTNAPAAERPSEQAEVKKDAAEVKTDTPVDAEEVKKDTAGATTNVPIAERSPEPSKEIKEAPESKQAAVEPVPSGSKSGDGPGSRPEETRLAGNKDDQQKTDIETDANKPAVTDAEKVRSASDTNKPAAPKLLFDPIIITIPDSRPRRVKTPRAGDTPNPETAKPAEQPPPPCSIIVSQETISLVNNGGTLGVLVNIDGPGDIKSLTVESSSAKDIEVVSEPEIGGVPDRRFYVVRSISEAVGVYTVTFAAPCGKKEVIVTVR